MHPARQRLHLASVLLLFGMLTVASASLFAPRALAATLNASVKPPTTLPAWRQSVADCVTGDHFVEGRKHNQPDPGCDDWVRDLYERPYNNSNHDHYYADQDLVRVQAADDNGWYYFRIELYGTHSGKLDALYGIEADVDGDGCSDWFWTSRSPTANLQHKVGYNAWGRDGVIAYYDADGDVGGKRCGLPDAGWSGSGYERLVSDQGGGEARDGLWAMSPRGAQDRVVVLAVQKQMLARKAGGIAPQSIRWRGWAAKGLQDKSSFQHHDKYTGRQAGAAYRSHPDYPTQNVYEDDNTNGLDALNQFPPPGTPTSTPVPPTATATHTPVPPTATATHTPVPPTATATHTPVPPTATATHTPVPPTATATHTPVPPTATATHTPVPTGSTLSGQLWPDDDYSGSQGPEEPGIPGVVIELYRDNGEPGLGPEDTFVAWTTTDENGNYSFPNLEEGAYSFLALANCAVSIGPILVDGQQPIVIDIITYSSCSS